ncbi:MAG: DUF6551 family protein [Sulfitobacter sp.]|uniref:ParB N-terminal domain-containing protein n=1 Tax=Sulfitobacter sp. TaxID=1903071 RepID=UPI0032985A47
MTERGQMAVAQVVRDLKVVAPAAQCGGVPAPEDVIRTEFLAPGQLIVDGRYQRMISDNGRTKIRKLIRDFDWVKFGALIVAELDVGNYAVIDGQHRAIAASALGVVSVPCIVVRANVVGQAVAFVGINSTRSSVASIDKFRARVTAGDAEAVTVDGILNDLGISTDVAAGTALAPHQTRAVSKLERIVKKHGRGIAFTVLEMLRDAQPDQKNLLTAFAIEVTSIVVARVIEKGGDLDRLHEVLVRTDFETLKDNASHMVKLTGGQTTQRGGELLLRDFNKGLRKPV